MISNRNVYGYIGGSDANRIYGSYSTKTFLGFWEERKTGVRLNEFSTLDTAVGNIMESLIADEVGIPMEYRDVFLTKEGTIAGCNYDALQPHCMDEIKTASPGAVLKILSGKKMSIGYRRQIMHGLYVGDKNLGRSHMLPMTKEQKKNPFLLDIKGKVHTFEFHAKDFDMEEHDRRVRYLTMCFSENVQPSDNELSIFT